MLPVLIPPSYYNNQIKYLDYKEQFLLVPKIIVHNDALKGPKKIGCLMMVAFQKGGADISKQKTDK